MVHHPWPATPDVIWHIYSHLYCSSRDGGRDLPSSKESGLTMAKVPCEFQADQPIFIFQPAAPDMIWHIYSEQCCLMGDGAIHLLSSGEVLLGLGRSPASPLVSATSPEDISSIPSTLPKVNVPNHVRSQWLKNEVWLISSKLTGDLPHCEGIIP